MMMKVMKMTVVMMISMVDNDNDDDYDDDDDDESYPDTYVKEAQLQSRIIISSWSNSFPDTAKCRWSFHHQIIPPSSTFDLQSHPPLHPPTACLHLPSPPSAFPSPLGRHVSWPSR